jgi:lysophospholipase L1-like esterase
VAVDVRLCFVGDSFVNGTGDDECLGWTGRVTASLRRVGYDVTYYNLGIRRETTADVAARWAAEVARRVPDALSGRVVFSCGVNDTTVEGPAERLPLDASVLNLRHMLQASMARFETLVVGPPPIAEGAQNERIARLSAAFSQVCAAEGVLYLDVFSPLARSGIWRAEVLAGDGAHPNAGGYQELASLVGQWSAWQAWWPRATRAQATDR